jgi:hypothetical protein
MKYSLIVGPVITILGIKIMKRKKETRAARRKRQLYNHVAIVNIEMESGLTSKDLRSILESRAINKMQVIGPVQAPRLNFTYKVDGYIFNTGKKHRKIG